MNKTLRGLGNDRKSFWTRTETLKDLANACTMWYLVNKKEIDGEKEEGEGAQDIPFCQYASVFLQYSCAVWWAQ